MVIVAYKFLLFKGIVITLISWIVSSIVSISVGSTVGIISATTQHTPVIHYACLLYTFIAKSIPAYVHILIAYFVIPSVLGISMPALLAGIVALSFCSSGYVAQIVQGAFASIDKGQWDAAFVLGYSLRQTIVRIIVPQAFKRALPALLGEGEQLLKSTSLLATIGITELTRTGMNIISRELNPSEVYCTIACIYLLFSAIVYGIVACIKSRARL